MTIGVLKKNSEHNIDDKKKGKTLSLNQKEIQ
jgi:hypothetical protein